MLLSKKETLIDLTDSEHMILLNALFGMIVSNGSTVEKILDAGSGKTSLSVLLGYFKNAHIDAIIFPGDDRKSKSIKKFIISDRYTLTEEDICSTAVVGGYDLVLAHLLLGESVKWGNKFPDLLNRLLKINSKYFIIYDIKEDPSVDFDYIHNYALSNDFKIVFESEIQKNDEQEFRCGEVVFLGKNYRALLLERE